MKSTDQPSRKIQHVILSNGFRATHCMSTLNPRNLEMCRHLLPDGGPVPWIEEPYHVTIEGPKFTLFRHSCPILAGGIGRGNDRTWKQLISLLDLFDQTYRGKPHPKLWLAIVLLPTITAFAPEEVQWMFDFQRHLAAAMFNSDANKPV